MRSEQRPCIVFTGGGTGGHIYPGLAVIEHIRQRWDGRIVWLGSKKPAERAAVEAAGIEFIAIPSGKFRRSLSLKNIPDIFRICAGVIRSRRILKTLHPRLVFSKGGYVSVPPALSAASLGIPLFTHESDVSPGLATKINAQRADTILLSWDRSLDYLSAEQKARSIVVGNPVRLAMSSGAPERGRAWLGFTKKLPIVLVLGGSQGALQINELIRAILPRFMGIVCIAHQTGPGNAPCRPQDEYYKGFEFIRDELPDVLAAADIIVGRAGAGTVWEGAAACKPMIFIPLEGAATRGDQKENAEMLSKAGAAVCLSGEAANPDTLSSAIEELAASSEKRHNMAMAARALARPDAAEVTAKLIVKFLEEKSCGKGNKA